MASGSKDQNHRIGNVRGSVIVTALAGIKTTDSGVWFDSKDIEKGTFEFLMDGPSGALTSFAAQICGSNALTKPNNTVDGFPIGASNTAVATAIALNTPARWLKIKTTAIAVTGQGSMGARLFAFTY